MHSNRDSWLEAAVKELRPDFAAIGFPLPAEIRTSVGFPFGGRGGKLKTIGQCWDAQFIDDKVTQIYISPTLGDPVEILAVLVHELVHAAVGCACGHRGAFRKAALAAGLEGKMTATTAGDALKARLQKLAADLGTLPHCKLDPSGRKKQGTRMLKAECEPCEYAVRLTRKMIDNHGCPICPSCGEQMVESV